MSRTFITEKLKTCTWRRESRGTTEEQLLMISGAQENDYLVMFQTGEHNGRVRGLVQW
jgi:hypothetical protein